MTISYHERKLKQIYLNELPTAIPQSITERPGYKIFSPLKLKDTDISL